MKIYITGCAKTGTTLVRRLFNAFDLNVYNHYEISLTNFLNSDYEVGKRVIDTVFSNTLPQTKIDEQLDLIRTNNIKIINVTRNKHDVLKSSNGWVPETRYDSTIEQSTKYSDFIDYTIQYERLLLEPDEIQKEIQDKFNLTKLYLWSEYPNFINQEQEPHYTKQDLSYSLRKIGESY